MPDRNLISRMDRFVLLRQYVFYSAGGGDINVTLQRADLSFTTPRPLTLSAASGESLKSLIETDGTHTEIFDSCIAAYVENLTGAVLYYGPFIDKSGETVVGTIGTDCPLSVTSGEFVVLGAN